MARASKPTSPRRSAKRPARARLYGLRVVLLNGPMSQEFRARNPVISRSLRLWGDQTLHDLHQAIQRSFDRTQEQLYEFTLPDDGGKPIVYVPQEAIAALKDG